MLVVVAIILILASLIFPSLKRALYIAHLTKCASNLSQLGKAVSVYTDDSKDNYPRRMANIKGNFANQLFRNSKSLDGEFWDDRPMLTPYMDLDVLLVCPLAPLENGVTLSGPATITSEVWAGYEMWYGSAFNNNDLRNGMMRVGDRPEYDGHSFDIIAADVELDYAGKERGAYWISSSHPDFQILQKVNFTQTNSPGGCAMSLYIDGWWIDPSKMTDTSNLARGTLDRNFLSDDGGVRTLMGLAYADPRTVRLPGYPGMPDWPVHSYLPPR